LAPVIHVGSRAMLGSVTLSATVFQGLSSNEICRLYLVSGSVPAAQL
jgi:hypothetical protein